jgi:hypothetical protein
VLPLVIRPLVPSARGSSGERPAANAEIQRTSWTIQTGLEAPTAATRTIAGAWFTDELGNQARVIDGA